MAGRAPVRRSLFATFSVALLALAPHVATAASAMRPTPELAELDVSPAQIVPGDPSLGNATLSFEASTAGTVIFTLAQVEPAARMVGAFRVRARPGLNRFLFPGPIDRRLLRPGTYRITPARADGETAEFVVLASAPRSTDERATKPLRAVLVATLLAAIVLLGAASIPAPAGDPSAAAVVVTRHRHRLAAAGAVALAVAVALYVSSVV